MIISQHFLLHWIVSAVAVLITSKVVSDFEIEGLVSALIAALGIGVANAVIWPVLIILTLPANILTLGLFTFIVNGATLKVAAFFLPGFNLKSWGAAIFGSIVLSLVSMFLHYFLV